MDLNVNVKVTIEASPTILGLLNGWMSQLERQQGEYLNALMDAMESRAQMNELASAAEPEKQVAEEPQEAPESEPEAEPKAEEPKKQEAKPEPMTKEEEDELRKMASQFIRAKAENREALKQWLDSKGFSRVTAVTRDRLEELKEVLRVA